MTVRHLVTTAAVLLLGSFGVILSVAGWAQAAQADQTRPDVVVVGIPGLRWDQVSASGTPALWRLASSGSVGALSIRSAARTTCAQDGWLSVGAGNRVRVGAGSCEGTSGTGAAGSEVAVKGWSHITADNKELHFGAVPGTLASAVNDQGGCVTAVGPAAVLGAADRGGRVESYAPSVTAESLSRCPVTMVSAPDAAGSATTADATVAEVVAARPTGSVLIVVGLSDPKRDSRAHLHVVVASGAGYGPGLLRSQSTRKTPYVQLIDVAATVLDLRGAGAAPGVSGAVDGQPFERTGGPADLATRVSHLSDLDKAAGAASAALPYGVVLLVVLLVAGLGLALAGWQRPPALLGPARAVLLVALAGPLATYLANLAPWWRVSAPTGAVLLLIAAIALLVGIVTHRMVSGTVVAAGTVTGLTFLVLVADVVSGSRLQMDSVLGYSPLVAGRFVGLGNVAYGIFGAAALLTATSFAVLRPGSAVPVVAGIGLVAVVADGAPEWGSDVGGVLALVPGFAVMVLLCAGARLSWPRAVAIGAAAVAVVLAFAVLDYARPASDQTHLGRFVGKILHGGAWTVLQRKPRADLSLRTTNVATLLVPVVVAAAVWLVLRPRPRLARAYGRAPGLRWGLVSLTVLALVGLMVNDSGLAIPAVAVLLGLPYMLTVLVGDTAAASQEPPLESQHVLP